MRSLVRIWVCAAAGVLALHAAQCLAVDGPSIRGADLLPALGAEAVSGMANAVLAPTPAPGLRIWIGPRALRRWGLDIENPAGTVDFCLERRVSALSPALLLDSVNASFARAGIVPLNLSLSGVSPLQAPSGHLQLSANGLHYWPGDTGTCLFVWRGAYEYDLNRTLPAALQGRFAAESVQLVAARDLPAGTTLSAADTHAQAHRGCPPAAGSMPAINEPLMTRVALREGETIRASMLRASPVVLAGRPLLLTASSGAARVEIETTASHDARAGEIILVRNPASGKSIRAEVTGNGTATAIAGRTAP